MRKLTALSILVFSILLIISQGCDGGPSEPSGKPPEEKKFEPFAFAVITDVHVGRDFSDYGAEGWIDYDLETGQAHIDPETRKPNEGEFNWVTDRLVATVDWLNKNYRKENIKFLVILGDISDSAEMSEFFRAKKILDNLEIPYIPLIGNHDVWSFVGNPPCKQISHDGEFYFEKIFWNELYNRNNIEEIKNLSGNTWKKQENTQSGYLQNYAFSHQGINFLGLDYAYRKSNCYASAAQVFSETDKWLKQNLESYRGEIIIVFSHYPYMVTGGFDPFTIDNFVLAVNQTNAKVLTFGGHIHNHTNINETTTARITQLAGMYYAMMPGVPVVVTKGLMGKDGSLKEKEDPDFLRIVKVNGPKIEDIDYEGCDNIINITIGFTTCTPILVPVGTPKITPMPTPQITCPLVGEPKFTQSQKIITTEALKVRENPGLSSPEIKAQPKGTTGKILEGPVCADNYIWWRVEYEDGTIGWSAENWLEILIRTPIPSPETPTTPEITPIITPILTVTPTPPTITPPPTIIPFGKCNEEIKENLINWAKEHTCDFPNIVCNFWAPWYWDSYFKDCDLVGEDVWAVGYLPAFGGYGSILYSPDNGKSWEIQWTSETFGPNPFAVDFLDMNEGFVATDDNILQTSDGGKTWQEIFRVKSYPGLKDWGVWLREFQVIDRLHLWGRLSEGIVIKTEDGGKTWLASRDEGKTWQPY